MSEKIVQLNEEVIKVELKELVRSSGGNAQRIVCGLTSRAFAILYMATIGKP